MGAANDLITHYQHVITDLKLVMGSKGVFDVTVDGELVYSKHETGRHAAPGEVLAAFEQHAKPARRYGD